MKFIDLFSGIGGFRLGMEQAGHECIAFCEIDKFALKSYKAIHDTEKEVEMHDITTISNEFIRSIGHTDVICGGFPCQTFSIAGRRKGFEDTRGTLFFEIARFASILRPRYLFLENVKGLLNHDGEATFETIIRALDDLGYDCEWDCVNSKDYVPQNRERIFIIGHFRGAGTGKVFPFERENEQYHKTVKSIGNINPSGNGINGNVYDIEGISPTLTTNKGEGIKVFGNLPGSHDQNSRVYDPAEVAPTLSTMQGGGQEPKIIQRPRGYNEGGTREITPTLTSNSWHENNLLSIDNGFKIRKLTPRECWRLQGFPDWAFDKAQKVNSDSQLYKQAGNSVTVPVIYEIAKRLKGDNS